MGFGFRIFANYRIRVLLDAGQPNWRTLGSLYAGKPNFRCSTRLSSGDGDGPPR